MKTIKDEKNIKELVKGIKAQADEMGYSDDASFNTIYHMLEVQVDMLDELEKSYKEDGSTVSKEYVKGRGNIYIHPAIKEYTKICDSAFNKILKLKEIMDKTNNTENASIDEIDLSED